MASRGDVPSAPGDDYWGFSLNSVSWGYRDVFRRTIEELIDRGLLGEHRPEITESFFSLLRNADRGTCDHVLRRFLGAVNPATRWLLDVPSIFCDIVRLGHDLATDKPHWGVVFFETFGAGGFGDTPGRVRDLLTHARRLRETDPELAVCFVRGYRKLLGRLSHGELEVFLRAVEEARAINPASAKAFLEVSTEGAEACIRGITREARLAEEGREVETLIKALSGMVIDTADIRELGAEAPGGEAPTCVFWDRRLYLPSRVRRFDARPMNRRWYTLAALGVAGAFACDSFVRFRGSPRSLQAAVGAGTDPRAADCFLLVEWARILRTIRTSWPGARALLRLGLEADSGGIDTPPGPDALEFLIAIVDGRPPPGSAELRNLVEKSRSWMDTAQAVRESAIFRDAAIPSLSPVSFLPDFRITEAAGPGTGAPVAGTPGNDAAGGPGDVHGDDADRPGMPTGLPGGIAPPGGEDVEHGDGAPPSRFVYDEWSQPDHDYRRDYCTVREFAPEGVPAARIPPDVAEEGRRVSRLFERLKPETMRKERRLTDGDDINSDQLIRFLVDRRTTAGPDMDFYEKPFLRRRELAVTVLLDASGSTAERAGGSSECIIDIERHAALILGEGLHALGDAFSVCAFNSNGRENCLYAVLKAFDQPWDATAMARVLAATPANSTRIGPALRHAGARMKDHPARKKLILLVTDGRPMDTGYDPNTGYAHQDVRKACEENAAAGIRIFAITTEENTVGDMEAMFPGQRFAILPDIRRLPKILPNLYTRLTL